MPYRPFILKYGHLFLRTLTLASLLFFTISCGSDSDSSKKGESPSSHTGGEGTTPTPTPVPTKAHLWVTASTYQGGHLALRSDASADAECTNRAAADAGALSAGVSTHKAVLGRTGGVHPKTFIAAATPIFRGDDTTDIVATYRDFFDSTKTSKFVKSGLNRFYWTGLDETDISSDCDGWTRNSNPARGRYGTSQSTDETRYGGCSACRTGCGAVLHLLCLSY